jgi:tRNA (cytosine34-C5)-methyltransferase
MHQLKRLQSPNFMIINHDASSLPNFRETINGVTRNIMYDRILADVPCSGDGTFRKNVDIWGKWNFAHACNLHGIQMRIANRAVELLKPGGLMVYSTCSFSPIENEAVVANILLKYKGKLELVDARHKLKGLKTVEGLTKWNVILKNGEKFENVEEVAKSNFVHLVKPSMFPPEEKIANELNLKNCIRVMPHHQNTGGFFIALIRKIANDDENEEKLKDEQPPEADLTRVMKAPPAKRVKQVYDENPFKFIDETSEFYEEWKRIKEFFDISDEFPLNQMMTRNRKNEKARSVYFVSKAIRDLTINNGDRIKFINMGVPFFNRADNKDKEISNMELRICQEV